MRLNHLPICRRDLRFFKTSICLALIAILIPGSQGAGQEIKQRTAKDSPPELGSVDWHRNLIHVQFLAARDKRPVFQLFQEVPG